MPESPAPTTTAATTTGARLRIDTARCAWRSLGDQIVVLDLRGSVYFELNPTAARLWPALVDGTDESALVRILADAGPADAAADVRAFLAELRAAGLLHEDEARG